MKYLIIAAAVMAMTGCAGKPTYHQGFVDGVMACNHNVQQLLDGTYSKSDISRIVERAELEFLKEAKP